jgi:hypothetical protein
MLEEFASSENSRKLQALLEKRAKDRENWVAIVLFPAEPRN